MVLPEFDEYNMTQINTNLLLISTINSSIFLGTILRAAWDYYWGFCTYMWNLMIFLLIKFYFCLEPNFVFHMDRLVHQWCTLWCLHSQGWEKVRNRLQHPIPWSHWFFHLGACDRIFGRWCTDHISEMHNLQGKQSAKKIENAWDHNCALGLVLAG